jgi:hypothetical protein
MADDPQTARDMFWFVMSNDFCHPEPSQGPMHLAGGRG